MIPIHTEESLTFDWQVFLCLVCVVSTLYVIQFYKENFDSMNSFGETLIWTVFEVLVMFAICVPFWCSFTIDVYSQLSQLCHGS